MFLILTFENETKLCYFWLVDDFCTYVLCTLFINFCIDIRNEETIVSIQSRWKLTQTNKFSVASDFYELNLAYAQQGSDIIRDVEAECPLGFFKYKWFVWLEKKNFVQISEIYFQMQWHCFQSMFGTEKNLVKRFVLESSHNRILLIFFFLKINFKWRWSWLWWWIRWNELR